MKRIETVLVSMLVVAGAAPMALAQESGARTVVRRNFDRPIEAAGQPGDKADKAMFQMSMTESDGTNTYTLSIINGEATAQINGEAVPADRLRKKGSSYEVLDKEGKVVHSFRVMGLDGGRSGRMWMQGGRGAPDAEGQPQGIVVQGRRPRVMIGINMSDAEGGGVTVDNVVPGLPASRGGLQEKDRIVKIDGKEIGSTSDVREVLRGKETGDEMVVVVRRGEETKDIALKLDAFDAERLGVPMLLDVPIVNDWNEQQDWYEEVKRAWDKALAEIKKHGGEGGDKLMAEVDQAWAEAMKSMAKAKEKTRQWWSDQGRARLFTNQDRFVVPAPPAPAAPAERLQPQIDRQLERLVDQLERLQRRLDEMEKRLEPKAPGGQ